MPKSKIGLVFMVALCLSFAGCPPPSGITVPNVVGQTQQAATNALVAVHLVLGTVTTQASDTVAAGYVISQNPLANASAASGAAVNLVVSTGPAPSVAWTYPASGSITAWGTSIAPTLDNGFIVGGGNGSYTLYALKLNAAGGKVWENNYSSPAPTTNLWRTPANGVKAAPDGGYIMVGAGNTSGDLLPSPSYLLVKLNATGGVAWSKSYAPQNPIHPAQLATANQPAAVDITEDSGFAAFGTSYGGPHMPSILKTNATGTQTLCKVIRENTETYNRTIAAGQRTDDNGYVMAGYTDGLHGYSAILIKVDSAGTVEWSKTFQFATLNYGATAKTVTQTADGGYLVGGELVNSITKPLAHGCWIAKVDEYGDTEWSRSYASTTVQRANVIKETPQGDFLVAGTKSGHLTLAKFNADGILLWNYSMEDEFTQPGQDLTLTDDGGCVIVASGDNGGPTVIVKVDNAFTPVP